MIDFDEFQKLKSRRNSVKESYEYAIRDLNNAMKDYDIKAEYEELNREYMRQSRIFDLEDEIEKYIDRIKYNNSLDNIILLKEVLNELYKIIK